MMTLSEIRNAYAFVHTNDAVVASQVKYLARGMNFQPFATKQDAAVLSGIFYNEKLSFPDISFFSVDKMNDLGDYDLKEFHFDKTHKLGKNFDSLISYCLVNRQGFVAGTDYLSIYNHYYFQDRETFICSNNMFITASLCNDTVSEVALIETLFFRFPYRNGTFFQSVKCLKPYQQLLFTADGDFILSNSVVYNDLILEDTVSMDEDIDSFFTHLKNPANLPPLLSFSGGSDSMTILSILKKKNYNCTLASFAGTNAADTDRIKKLATRTRCPSYFDQSEKFGKNLEDEIDYAFLTNGYSPSPHFYRFYKNLPGKFQVFDGYSAMLGDWSEAFLHFPYRQVLQGQEMDTVLKKNFSSFDDKFLNKMKEYLLDNYKDIFININTEDGLKNIRQYAVDFIPGKILSRVYKCNTNFGHLNVSFFQSRKFISFVEKNNFGIAKTCSARNDYPGYVVNRFPLGLIAHHMDKRINRLPLSYGLSLSDMYSNHKFVPLKKKIHVIKRKIHSFGRPKEIKPVLKEEINLDHFNFIKPGSQLNYLTKRELSLFNNAYSVLDNLSFVKNRTNA